MDHISTKQLRTVDGIGVRFFLVKLLLSSYNVPFASEKCWKGESILYTILFVFMTGGGIFELGVESRGDFTDFVKVTNTRSIYFIMKI